ncbi:monofunctional biosynthetic peptidoglycan transglycosylase [Bartonella bacilliformis]|uniref:monofunctional biosynthetic peptidoglycan transglycosylase n=1 Tax=Bartonella bacilliformis TaxID=774 RepID=UPI000A4BB68E|nr:monofunctional biosynthetic peptidoglycan transglycosylase [Bartonella bacilliformis]
MHDGFLYSLQSEITLYYDRKKKNGTVIFMVLSFLKKRQDDSQKRWCCKIRTFVVYSFLCLLFLPIILLLIYRLTFVHPVSTLMMRDVLTRDSYQREWVALSDVSFAGPAGIIVSEDGNFCRHYGVDWNALLTILRDETKPWRGGSTITMQVVKNLFLWSHRSYVRKGLEIFYSLMADFLLSKKRIMEIYINIAEWGPGIYGIEAAALYYYKKSARALTIQQAAALVASLPNPYVRNPHQPTDHFLTLSRMIEQRIIFSGAYTHCLC